MVTRGFLVGLTISLMCSLVIGCGVPQEDYDTVVAEADTVKAQIPSLENELSEAQSGADKVESDLASVQNELAKEKSDLEVTLNELDSAEDQASSAEKQASSLQSQVSSLQSDIDAVQEELDEAEATIAELEEEIAAAEEAEAAEEEAEPKLLVLWRRGETTGTYYEIYGAVKNISDESLSDVEVVVYAWDDTGNYHIESALIDKNPLLPGQTSSFRVTFSSGIVLQTYNLYFRFFLLGGTIPFEYE